MFADVFDAVSDAAGAAARHEGLQLARRGAATVLECGPSGWLFDVDGARVVWAWRTWSCGCAAGERPCAHVVAAAWTLRAAGELVRQAPAVVRTTTASAYRLRSDGDRVVLRVVRRTEGPGGRPVEVPRVGSPDADDLLVAAIPAGRTEVAISPESAGPIVAALAHAADVTLDGAPVRVLAEPQRVPLVESLDASGSTVLVPEPPPDARVFAGSRLVRSGDALRRCVLVEPPPPAPAESGSEPAAAPAPEDDPERERQTLQPAWDTSGPDPTVMFQATGPEGQTVQVPAEQVVQAWRTGTLAVQGLGGGLLWLPRDWLERWGAVLEQFVAARLAKGATPRWARPAAAALCEALQAPPPPELAGLAALARDFSGVPAAPLPADFRGELRDYQRRGVDWLCLLRDAGIGALLADDMGLGKTLQTICALRGRALVVAPTSTLHNWAAELRRFRPGLRVSLFHGPRRALDAAADVTLTSYAVLRLDQEILAKEAWDVVALDEAQAIKEPTTATASAAFSLQAGWRVALSGTPVQNRLTELWSLCHFLNPGLLGGLKDFVARYERQVEGGQARRTSELQAKLRPFVLRRRKSEVARELPPRTEIVLRCALDPHERRVYDGLRVAAQADLLPRLSTGGDMLAALELLLRLRQAACHVGLVPGQQATRSSKLDLLLSHLSEVTGAGHRALVFSQWTGLLDLVEDALTSAALAYVRLDGSTVDRAGVVAAFQAPEGPPVMLISLKAGGTGLNLTAADYVYLLDPWWNPAAEDQAADRAHRIGQERPVFVHRLVAEDTVEEKILELHQRKRALAGAAIDEGAAAGLTRDDLLELLR